MNGAGRKPTTYQGYENEFPAPSLRSIVRKSALLNLTIVLTSFPVLVLAGGPSAVVPTLAIMAGISILIWSTTFALFSFVSLVQIFRTSAPSAARPVRPQRAGQTGVADRWLDGPG